MSTVSLIIPTYNRAPLVGRAIESALAQSHQPTEIIVVDDGSTDSTQDVLTRYGSPVRVIMQPTNRGRSAARNRGMDAARGDYVAFLDSDDSLPRTSIERRVQVLDANPAASVVYGDANVVDTQGRVIRRFSALRPHQRPSGSVFYHMLLNNLAPIHAYMFRKTDIRMDETLHTLEDYDFWLTLACGNQFIFIDEALADYHIHADMTTHREDTAMRRTRVTVQGRGIRMACFAALSPRERGHVLTVHGASHAAVMGDMREARHFLRAALKLHPLNPRAWLYWLVTWSGTGGVNALNGLRRAFNRHVTRTTFPSDSGDEGRA